MGLHCTNIFYSMCMFIYFSIEGQYLNEALEETMNDNYCNQNLRIKIRIQKRIIEHNLFN